MKKRILPALGLLFISAGTLQAQVGKGKLLLGGSVGFNTTSNTQHETSSNLGISPRVGYAIGRNWVVGLFGSFDHNVNRSPGNGEKVINTGYSFNAYWRKYMPIQNKVGWYAEFNGGLSNSTSKNELTGGTSKTKYKGYNLGAIPGVYYQVLPGMLIFANAGGLGYDYSKQEPYWSASSLKYSSFSVSFFKDFGFGVDFILGKKS